MQTFLPEPDFRLSAQALDNARLGKQRVENLQILRAITDAGYGWQHHPAVHMWRGHARALLSYQIQVVVEWTERFGSGDTCLGQSLEEIAALDRGHVALSGGTDRPPWFGHEGFHASHRSNLIRKDPAHYRPLWPDEPDDLPYVWPTKAGLMEVIR